MTQDSPRTIWSLTGKDALSFLQGLVTNDLRPLEAGPGIVWAALLTPQGPRQSSAAAATDGQPPPTPVTRRTRCARMRHPARA